MTEYEQTSLGLRLRKLRKEKKVTIKEAAIACDMSYTALAQFELGDRIPPMSALKKLSAYYNVDIEYLVGNTDIPDATEIDVEIKELSSSEKELMDAYAKCDKRIKNIVDFIIGVN